MKRSWCMVLIAALLLGAGCGSRTVRKERAKDEILSQKKDVENTEASQKEEETEIYQEIESSASESSENTKKNSKSPDMTKTEEELRILDLGFIDYSFSEWNVNPMVQASTVFPSMEEDLQNEYPALAKQFKALQEEKLAAYTEDISSLKELSSELQDTGISELTETEDGVLVRADSRVVSYCFVKESYRGGAYPDKGFFGKSYDTESGRELKLSDVVRDVPALAKLVDQKLRDSDYGEKLYGYSEDITEKVTAYIEEGDPEFILGNEAITLFFNYYTLGPHVMGYQIVNVYYSEEPELFYEKYMETPKNYVLPWIEEVPMALSLNGGSARQTLQIEKLYGEEEYDYTYHYEVRFGGKKLALENGSFGEDCWVMYCDGRYYLYLLQRLEGDYQYLNVLDLASMQQVERETRDSLFSYSGRAYYEREETEYGWSNYFYPVVNPDSFYMGSRMNILGTYSAAARYRTGEDGFPVQIDPDYQGYSSYAVKTKAAIEAWTLNAYGEPLSKSSIPENRYFVVDYTDGKSYVDVLLLAENDINSYGTEEYPIYELKEDTLSAARSDMLRIYLEASDYESSINGVSEKELFLGMMYAG